MPEKVKEKPPISRKAKEKAVAAPKEHLRRGLLSGTEKLRGQLRDAAEGGPRQETEADRVQNTAQTAARQAVYRLKKLVWSRSGHKTEAKTYEGYWGQFSEQPHAEHPASAAQARQPAPPDSVKPARIKTRDAAPEVPSAPHGAPVHPPTVSSGQPVVKTKADYIQHQTADAIQVSGQQRRQEFVRERGRKAAARQADVRHRAEQIPSTPVLSERSKTKEQASYGRPDSVPPARPQRDNAEGTSAPRFRPQRQTSGPDRKPVQRGRFRDAGKIKSARLDGGTPGRAAKSAVKTASPSSARAAGRSAAAARQTTRAAMQAQQRAVQAVGAARRTVAAVDRPVAKAAASALRGAVTAIRALMAPLAAGGGAVIAVVLVLCLVGALLLSPLGIFFSGEDSGGQTMSAVVREINLEYDAKLEELKSGAVYDEVKLDGARAPWPEVLAIYAVKTTSDPLNGQEVVTMDDGKKELLRQVFWDMNQLSSFTSTVPGEGDDEDGTTTLHITVTAKTAEEMADVYGFDQEQRKMLTELLSDEYRELWNAVLYCGWYAPAVNMHRSPFNGRNYEYYSEDSVLSGVLCGNTVQGASEAGVYTYVKHFICNDGESGVYRDSVYTWMTEQALREIYLEPFRTLVEDYDANGLMSSYNRIGAVWAGGSKALLTDVLRGEWGFHGGLITDYCDHHTFMNGDQSLRAGTSLWMSGVMGGEFVQETSSNSYHQALRRAAKEVLYMTLHVRVTNRNYSETAGDVSIIRPAYKESGLGIIQPLIYVVIALGVALIALCIRFLVIDHKLRKELKAQQ